MLISIVAVITSVAAMSTVYGTSGKHIFSQGYVTVYVVKESFTLYDKGFDPTKNSFCQVYELQKSPVSRRILTTLKQFQDNVIKITGTAHFSDTLKYPQNCNLYCVGDIRNFDLQEVELERWVTFILTSH